MNGTSTKEDRPVMDIVLHLGAHMAASTHLQNALAQNQAQLRAHKIAFHGPTSLRPALAHERARQRAVSRTERDACRYACLSRLIDQARNRGMRRIILSEAQFLGSLRDVVGGADFYADARETLAPVIQACAGHRLTVLLAVTSYDDFLISAYDQVVRCWGYVPFDDRMRKAFLSHQRGWPELVDDIQGLLPAASNVWLWRSEEARQMQDVVLQMLAGPAAASLRNRTEHPIPGLSQDAVEALDTQARSGHPPDRPAIKAILDTRPTSEDHAAFNPWSAEERLYLTARYRQDQMWMSARPGHAWIQPPCPVAA